MRTALTLGAVAARSLATLLRRWPLVLIALFLISPVGPHLRLSYSYYEGRAHPNLFFDCTYLGSRGVITPAFGTLDGCPILAWIDAREATR